MTAALLILFLIQCIACFILFKTMFRRRKTFQERFAMTLTTCSSTVLGLNLSTLIYLMLGAENRFVPIFAIGLGMMIGISYGAIFKFHSAFSGFYHGATGAIMGTMLGAVIVNPELCGLPASANTNFLAFGFFGGLVSFITVLLLLFSLKV